MKNRDLSQIDLEKIFSFAEQLIQSKTLFSGLKTSENKNWLIIDDLLLAVDCATSQNIVSPAIQIWGDLREEEAGRIPWVKGLYLLWEKGVGEKIYQYMTSIGADEDLFADIDSDLYNICLMDYFMPKDVFWEMTKDAYQKGVWPCGWTNSKYPNGNLIVFNPKKLTI